MEEPRSSAGAATGITARNEAAAKKQPAQSFICRSNAKASVVGSNRKVKPGLSLARRQKGITGWLRLQSLTLQYPASASANCDPFQSQEHRFRRNGGKTMTGVGANVRTGTASTHATRHHLMAASCRSPTGSRTGPKQCDARDTQTSGEMHGPGVTGNERFGSFEHRQKRSQRQWRQQGNIRRQALHFVKQRSFARAVASAEQQLFPTGCGHPVQGDPVTQGPLPIGLAGGQMTENSWRRQQSRRPVRQGRIRVKLDFG